MALKRTATEADLALDCQLPGGAVGGGEGVPKGD